jgi:hypothetical protein
MTELPVRRFAILFAGAADKYHLNDFELSYRMLTGVFDYDPRNIWVLFNDGDPKGRLFRDADGGLRKWPGSADEPSFQIRLDGPGTKYEIQRAFAELVSLGFGANDSLFLHTEGHGGHDNGDADEKAFLAAPTSMLEQSQYHAWELAADLQKLAPSRSLLVLMNQCYGGAFKASVLNGSRAARTYIACAAGSTQRAFPATGPAKLNKWSDFALAWMEAQMDRCVNGDALPMRLLRNPDRTLAASDAFGYALARAEHGDSANFGAAPGADAGAITLR